MEKKFNVCGLIGMILGILALVLFIFVLPSIVLGIAGLVLSIIGLKNPSKGMAIAGLCLSGVAIIIALVLLIL